MQIQSRRINTTQGWRTIDGRKIFFRSQWEYTYAIYLQLRKKRGDIKDWEHEPETFWFEGIRRGTTNYKPDFRVDHLDESREWVEVKGFYDAKSLTKINRFRKYFPQEKLTVIDSGWFKRNNAKICILSKTETK